MISFKTFISMISLKQKYYDFFKTIILCISLIHKYMYIFLVKGRNTPWKIPKLFHNNYYLILFVIYKVVYYFEKVAETFSSNYNRQQLLLYY